MKFKLETAELFVPDGLPAKEALERTTHMAFGAHQDDLEIMAYDGIITCFQQPGKWYTGVVVTNGSGSARDDIYKEYTDDDMRAVRARRTSCAAVRSTCSTFRRRICTRVMAAAISTPSA